MNSVNFQQEIRKPLYCQGCGSPIFEYRILGEEDIEKKFVDKKVDIELLCKYKRCGFMNKVFIVV